MSPGSFPETTTLVKRSKHSFPLSHSLVLSLSLCLVRHAVCCTVCKVTCGYPRMPRPLGALQCVAVCCSVMQCVQSDLRISKDAVATWSSSNTVPSSVTLHKIISIKFFSDAPSCCRMASTRAPAHAGIVPISQIVTVCTGCFFRPADILRMYLSLSFTVLYMT